MCRCEHERVRKHKQGRGGSQEGWRDEAEAEKDGNENHDGLGWDSFLKPDGAINLDSDKVMFKGFFLL